MNMDDILIFLVIITIVLNGIVIHAFYPSLYASSSSFFLLTPLSSRHPWIQTQTLKSQRKYDVR